MEVHHPHHPTHKKKWTEYLTEFLMLFFAVFLGFLVENYREHKVEQHKTKDFMHTMLGNLQYDTTRCANNFRTNVKLQDYLDSLKAELSKAIKGEKNTNQLYYYYAMLGKTVYYAAFNTSALSQLQSSGTLRLVHDDSLVITMLDYYNRRIRTAERFFDQAQKGMIDFFKTSREFFNFEYMEGRAIIKGNHIYDSVAWKQKAEHYLYLQPSPELLKSSPAELHRLYNEAASFGDDVARYNDVLDLMKNEASKLMGKIRENYGE